MELSDFLNIVGILVTIICGFFIAHWASVKDSRTRSIKDYYIDWIKQIQKEVDKTFEESICGEMSSKKLISWYGYYQYYIENFDIAVRKDLPVRIEKLFENIDGIYCYLTAIDEFNGAYDKSKFTLDSSSRVKIVQMKKDLDLLFSKYIGLINNVPPKSCVKRFCHAFHDDYLYYNSNYNVFVASIRAIWNVICIYIFRAIILLVICWFIFNLWCLYSKSQQKNKSRIDQLEMKVEYNNRKIDSLNIIIIKNEKNKSEIDQLEIETKYINRKIDSLNFFFIKDYRINCKGGRPLIRR